VKKIDVLVVGGVGIDQIIKINTFPIQYQDALLVGPIKEYVAHTGNGVVRGCHFLGMRTHLLDLIGDDWGGDLIKKDFEKAQIPFSYCLTSAGTKRSVNFVDKKGQRMSFYDPRHSEVESAALEQYLNLLLPDTAHVHLSIMDYVKQTFKTIKAFSGSTSTDLHDWDGKNNYHRDFAYFADIVFLSDVRISNKRKAIILDIFNNGIAKYIIIMAGKDGAYLSVRDGILLQHFPAIDIGKDIIDTNGAGDAFVASFLYGHCHKQPIERCMLFGNISGAYACTSEGTHQFPINEQTLLKF